MFIHTSPIICKTTNHVFTTISYREYITKTCQAHHQLQHNKSKACLTKPFEKTEIKWSPYLGKHSQQATFTQHYVLPKTSNGQSIHRFQTQCNETTSKPQKL